MSLADEISKVIRKIASSGESHQVVVERVFDTDPADLWEACTHPRRLSRWFGPVSGDLVVGGRYTLTGSGTAGDVLRCEPERHLAITWEYQGSVSRVDVHLVPAASRSTVLRLTHHVPPDEHWETYGPAATGVGWEAPLQALALDLAGDARCAPEEMAELARTPAGRDLTCRVASAWGLADRDQGTPSTVAEARAARTAAFYLAELDVGGGAEAGSTATREDHGHG